MSSITTEEITPTDETEVDIPLFTAQGLIDAVRKVAANNPDFVYNIPSYTASALYMYRSHKGKFVPGCLFGHAFFKLLGSEKTIDLFKTNASAPIYRVFENAGISFFTDEMEWIMFVQNRQDARCAWARAVECADEFMIKKYGSVRV